MLDNFWGSFLFSYARNKYSVRLNARNEILGMKFLGKFPEMLNFLTLIVRPNFSN